MVSPPISTYRLSASLWSRIFAVPHVSVPSAAVVIMEQLARLVTAREVPEIPPATSSFVCGVVSPMPTSPLFRIVTATASFTPNCNSTCDSDVPTIRASAKASVYAPTGPFPADPAMPTNPPPVIPVPPS